MNVFEKVSVASAMGTIVGEICILLLDALILWLVCGILLPVFPWIAAFAGLTYMDWVGIGFFFNVFCRWVGKLAKAVWAK